MSELTLRNLQIGLPAAAATENFHLRTPVGLPGRLRMSRGNIGAPLQDIFDVTESGILVPTQGIAPPNNLGMRNKIQNGSFLWNLRNAGNLVNAGGWVADRWLFANAGLTTTAGVTAGSTISNVSARHLFIQAGAVASPAAGSYAVVQHKVEGFNVQDLRWGRPNPLPLTLSFLGFAANNMLMSVTVRNADATRTHAKSVAMGPTVTKYSMTFPPCLDGTWDVGGGAGVQFSFALSVGSTYVAPSADTWVNGNYLAAPNQSNGHAVLSNYFAIGDVQAEVGAFATATEPVDLILERLRMNRYYRQMSGVSAPAKTFYSYYPFETAMRIGTPAMSIVTGSLAGADYLSTSNGFYSPQVTQATGTAGWTVGLDAEI